VSATPIREETKMKALAFILARGRHRIGVGIGLVALLVCAGAALAAIPSDGVVHTCFKKSGGSLRVIDAAVTQCGKDETALDWNQAGPQGPQGEKGDSGPHAICADAAG